MLHENKTEKMFSDPQHRMSTDVFFQEDRCGTLTAIVFRFHVAMSKKRKNNQNLPILMQTTDIK